MAQIKGRFIILIGVFCSLFQQGNKDVDNMIHEKTGKFWDKIDPDEWFEASVFSAILDTYAKGSPTGEEAIVTLGRSIFPTIKNTVGLPAELKTPLDYINYESETFMFSHKGADVRPRKIIRSGDHEVLIEAPAPGYNSRLYEGVYAGILDMTHAGNGKVVQTKSQEKGDSTSEFHITWG